MKNRKVIDIALNEDKIINQDTTADLLKYFSEMSKDDIDNFLSYVRGNQKDEVDPKLEKYLTLVAGIFRNTPALTYGDQIGNRRQLFEIYDEMDSSTAYISSALDILSDDATQPDDDGNVITINASNDKVKNLVEDLFIDLEIEEKLSKWARTIAKYGDFFIKINYDEEGIKSVIDTIYPSDIERKEVDGKLVAFYDNLMNSTKESIHAPWDYVHFRHKGILIKEDSKTQMSGIGSSSNTVNLTSMYGQSILKPAIKVYAQLRFVENLMILAKLTNSVRRNIFLINTGEQSPEASLETVRLYADLLKKDISLDVESQVYRSQKHTVNYDEDIFIPVADTKNDFRVESIGGDANIGEQYDIEYLQNKLFSALKIPKAYLNYEQDLNARSTLIQLDIRYARSVKQLQTALLGGLVRLAKIHLVLNGIDPDFVDLDIQLTPVSSIDEESRLESLKSSVDAATTVWNMLTAINDKLSEGSGDSSEDGGNPFAAMMSEKSENESKDTPIDLKYAAEQILTKYCGFETDEVSKLLRKKPKSADIEDTSKKLLESKRFYGECDLHAMYPTNRNKEEFSRLVENINKEEENPNP